MITAENFVLWGEMKGVSTDVTENMQAVNAMVNKRPHHCSVLLLYMD